MGRIIPPLLLVALANCGAAGDNRQAHDEAGTGQTFALASQSFADGQPIPAAHTCDGTNRPPELHWTAPPGGTRSLALVMDDPDAPGGTFRHWGVGGIPANVRSMQQGGAVQVVNDFGTKGYGGPCPPHGERPHRYRFKLYALDVERLSLPGDARVDQFETLAAQHRLAVAQLVGTYRRK